MIKLGIITGTHGVDGKMFIMAESDIKIDFKKINSLGIGFSEKYSKIYQVLTLEKYNNGYLLKLNDINSKEQADAFKEQAVYISEEFLQNKKVKTRTDAIIGYTVYDDKTHGKIGVIEDILEIPAHDVLVVKDSNKEILIPFIDEFVTSIAKGKVYVSVIPGLLLINDNENKSENYE